MTGDMMDVDHAEAFQELVYDADYAVFCHTLALKRSIARKMRHRRVDDSHLPTVAQLLDDVEQHRLQQANFMALARTFRDEVGNTTGRQGPLYDRCKDIVEMLCSTALMYLATPVLIYRRLMQWQESGVLSDQWIPVLLRAEQSSRASMKLGADARHVGLHDAPDKLVKR